ncbi:MAG: DUF2752 domain-containing protein [Propionibacteriaceae bacterium]|nr:DUF2752 domain-containing protein [Propionibacteriaceae bacterium]
MEISQQMPATPPRDHLIAVGAFVCAGVAVSVLTMATGVGVPCPFRMISGWMCPFCGGTTMGISLLHGDLASAWRANQALMVIFPVIGVRTIGWIVEAIRHPKVGSRWLPRWFSQHWLAIFVTVAVAWTLLRNLFL